MRDEYRTLAAEHRFESDPVKGSRFLASLAPAPDAAAAEAFLARVRAELRDATHHCWAWRAGPAGETFRSSDDGEPGGSAGRPILQQLEGHDVTDAIAVVTRWFGGTKLGVGGLVRAYGGAAGQALDRAPLRTVVVTARVVLEHPYELTRAVEGLLGAYGLTPATADYGALVRLELDLPLRVRAAFESELGERTGGRVGLG